MSPRFLIFKPYCNYYQVTLTRHITQTIARDNNKKSDSKPIPICTATSESLEQQGKTKRFEEKYEECEKLLKIKEATNTYLLMRGIIRNDETRKAVMQNITVKDITQKLNESYMKTVVCKSLL